MEAERTIDAHPAVRDALQELEASDAVRRLYAKDDSLWSDEPEHRQVAATRLGWLDVAGGRPGWSDRLREFAAAAHADGLDRVVLAGMGGSSLAPEVFAKVAGDGARLEILDSTHPDAVEAHLRDLERTLVLVSSKSGGTEETQCFGATAAARVPSPSHLVAITDPGSALAEQAREGGWRAVFENPSDIGGRYSALSFFGMVPAALAGIDIDEIWSRGQELLEDCGPDVPVERNAAAQLGAFMGGLARTGRDKLTIVATSELAPLGDWVEQLVAESTGKQGRGVIPVVGEPIGEPSVYGNDRAFVELRLGGRPVDGVRALADAGHPVLSIDVPDAMSLGAEFVRWELATALAGKVLGVDPFDEPNVAESKANTRAVLDTVLAGSELPEPEQGDISGLLASVKQGDYLSIQCYLAPSRDVADALGDLRVALRDETGCATTLGWGPRFLHSTGQLHKGGPASVVALQIVDAPEGGPSIPDREYSFATLVRAQAVGDLQSLRDHGLRVAQSGVSGPDELAALADVVREGISRFGGRQSPA
jgi:glucose-6-phosphate isomerase